MYNNCDIVILQFHFQLPSINHRSLESRCRPFASHFSCFTSLSDWKTHPKLSNELIHNGCFCISSQNENWIKSVIFRRWSLMILPSEYLVMIPHVHHFMSKTVLKFWNQWFSILLDVDPLLAIFRMDNLQLPVLVGLIKTIIDFE